MVRPETVIESWKTVRQDTVQTVEEFPASEFGFKPTEDQASFGEIARHILDASHAIVGMLLDGQEDLAGPGFRDLIQRYKPGLPEALEPAALAAELRSSLETQSADLAARDAGFYAKMVTRFDGQQVTRLELIQFVKEHELTHRQQLFLYSRLKGIVPPTTRRRAAKAKT